jgi:hypothetical protein
MLGDGSEETHGKNIRARTGQSLKNQALLLGICLLNKNFRTVNLDERFRGRKHDVCLWVQETYGDLRKPINLIKKLSVVHYEGLVYDLDTGVGDFAVGLPNFIRAHNTQQGRFDLSSGLGRRMYFMNWVPTPEEGNALKKAYWDGLNIAPDKPALDKIRTEVSNLIDRVESIRKVDFDPAIPNLLGDVPHFEHRLHAHFAIGHQIMSGDFTDHLYVSMDETLRKLMVTAKSWREHLLSEAEGDQIIQILVQAGGKCTGIEICGRMLGFGSSVRQTRDILWRLANRARLIDWNEKEDSITLKHPFKP